MYDETSKDKSNCNIGGLSDEELYVLSKEFGIMIEAEKQEFSNYYYSLMVDKKPPYMKRIRNFLYMIQLKGSKNDYDLGIINEWLEKKIMRKVRKILI